MIEVDQKALETFLLDNPELGQWEALLAGGAVGGTVVGVMVGSGVLEG